MRHPHRWEQLLPEEFFAEQARAPIVYWACGAMEDHGLQCALGVDPLSAYEVCLRAAAITGGIVHPPIMLAPAAIPGLSRAELRSGETYTYPPSLWVSREACELVYTELLESMADLGFRVCIAVGGHYPAELLLRELEKSLEGRVGEMRFWGGGTAGVVKEVFSEQFAKEPGLFGHGTMWETSNIMALDTDWVDLARVDRIRTSDYRSQLQLTSDANLERIKESSPDFGNRFYDAAAAYIAAVAQQRLLLSSS